MKVTTGLAAVIATVLALSIAGCSDQDGHKDSMTYKSQSIDKNNARIVNLSTETSPDRQSEAACWEGDSPGIYATFRSDAAGIGPVGFVLRQNGEELQNMEKPAYYTAYDTSARSIEIFGAFEPGSVQILLTGADGSKIEIVVSIPENQCTTTPSPSQTEIPRSII